MPSGRGLHAEVKQLCRYDRDLQQREGNQRDRESNVTHGLILSGSVVTGSNDLMCFLEHDSPIAGCNNLLAAGQRPMGTGSGSVKPSCGLLVTGELRIGTGKHAGAQISMLGGDVVCIAAVVRKADRILLVRQAPGHSLQGQWTVPWGAALLAAR